MALFIDLILLGDNFLSFTYVLILIATLAATLVLCFPLIARWHENYLTRLSFAALAEELLGSAFGSGCLSMSVGAGWNRFPEVSFDRNGVSFRVRSDPSHRNRHERVLVISANWPDRTFRLRLTPESFASKYKRFVGIDDIEVGDDHFDDLFVVQSNNPEKLDGILNSETRDLLVGLFHSGSHHEFDLQIVGGEFTGRRIAEVTSEKVVQDQVERFVAVYNSMIKAWTVASERPPGGDEITFLGSDVIREGQGEVALVVEEQRVPTCLFCGTEILERRVDCRSCHTPHHKECWGEVGRCTVYGCGEKRARKPIKPRRKSSKRQQNRKKNE